MAYGRWLMADAERQIMDHGPVISVVFLCALCVCFAFIAILLKNCQEDRRAGRDSFIVRTTDHSPLTTHLTYLCLQPHSGIF